MVELFCFILTALLMAIWQDSILLKMDFLCYPTLPNNGFDN